MRLNCLPGIRFRRIAPYEELRQQDYRGRRAHIEISDASGYSVQSKIDFGVQKDLDIQQEEFCFEVGCFDGKATLLVNSKEQMVTEKIKSLLRFGPRSTRYKDVYDIDYLLPFCDSGLLEDCFQKQIFSDTRMRENDITGVLARLAVAFEDPSFLVRLGSSGKNWTGKPQEKVIENILIRLHSI